MRASRLVVHAAVSAPGEQGLRSLVCRSKVAAACCSHAPPLWPPVPQDKAQVLSDVRSIIAEQLGTEVEKASRRSPPPPAAARLRCSSECAALPISRLPRR